MAFSVAGATAGKHGGSCHADDCSPALCRKFTRCLGRISTEGRDELRVALAVAGNFRAATAKVDLFGTESYGVALITGTLKKGVGPASVICVMDKKTGKAELSGESKDWVTVPTARH